MATRGIGSTSTSGTGISSGASLRNGGSAGSNTFIPDTSKGVEERRSSAIEFLNSKPVGTSIEIREKDPYNSSRIFNIQYTKRSSDVWEITGNSGFIGRTRTVSLLASDIIHGRRVKISVLQ